MTIRVLVVDDHPLFRQEVASILANEREFEVVGQAENGLQAVEMARRLLPDVVLMDVSMPIMEGPEATRLIKDEMPQVKVVIVTVSVSRRTLLEAVTCGAEAFLLKKFEPKALCGAIRAVVRDEHLMAPVMAARILHEYPGEARDAAPPPVGGLTQPERETLERIAEGGSREEIASELAIAESAVNDILHGVLGKLRREPLSKSRFQRPRERPTDKPSDDPR